MVPKAGRQVKGKLRAGELFKVVPPGGQGAAKLRLRRADKRVIQFNYFLGIRGNRGGKQLRSFRQTRGRRVQVHTAFAGGAAVMRDLNPRPNSQSAHRDSSLTKKTKVKGLSTAQLGTATPVVLHR